MRTLTLILWVLVAFLVIAMTGIGIGAYLNETFAAIAPALLAAVMGPLITAISGLSGMLIGQGLKKAVVEELKNQEPERQ